MAEATQQATRILGSKTGVVTSTKGLKTIHVMIETLVKHPQYGKYLRRRKTLAVDAPTGAVREGDVVEIVPCRRLSKTKSWRLARVVRAGQGPMIELKTESKG